MKSGIYKIINLVDQKIYLGSAKSFPRRWTNHKSTLNRNKHDNIHLQRAWNKNGPDNFKFEIIELCEINNLLIREQFWMEQLKPDYNFRKIATSNLGLKYNYTEESKLKLKTTLGKKLSLETRKRMSESKKGHKHTEEAKTKMREKATGRKHTEETKRKLSLINTNAPLILTKPPIMIF